jgi:RhtB (resistance to homoserine/threonine) family protein
MILGIENIMVFLGAGILVNLYPGPDTFYIVGRSVAQGKIAGVSAALGISTGAMGHTLLGAFGFSALIATSAHAFMVLKFVGAGYLIFQGITMLFGKTEVNQRADDTSPKENFRKIFRQGALTNLFNPKVAVFFIAFLPQFISPESSDKVLSFIILGLVFITTGTIWCLIVAIFASSMSKKLRSNSSISKWLMKINGALFISLGLKLATAKITN